MKKQSNTYILGLLGTILLGLSTWVLITLVELQTTIAMLQQEILGMDKNKKSYCEKKSKLDTLSHEKTIVIFDDTVNKEEWVKYWNVGPNKAWKEAKSENLIKEMGTLDIGIGKGQSWGYYVN